MDRTFLDLRSVLPELPVLSRLLDALHVHPQAGRLALVPALGDLFLGYVAADIVYVPLGPLSAVLDTPDRTRDGLCDVRGNGQYG